MPNQNGRRKPENKHQIDLMALIEKYHDEGACRRDLRELRWPNGVACPRCGSLKIRNSYTRNMYDCGLCGYDFSVTSGTMLHQTHLPLQRWIVATYLMIESRNEVSSNQLKRTLAVSYNTARHLCHRIRAAMKDAYPVPLKDIVEIDKTFVGSKTEGDGLEHNGDTAVVVGAVKRNGKIALKVIQGRDLKPLHRLVDEITACETEAHFSYERAPYQAIGSADTGHEIVEHSIEEWTWVEGYTNSVDNIWSLLKRSIVGTYQQVSVNHLVAYLEELEWCFNKRDNPWLFRDTLLKLLCADNIPYGEPVSEE